MQKAVTAIKAQKEITMRASAKRSERSQASTRRRWLGSLLCAVVASALAAPPTHAVMAFESFAGRVVDENGGPFDQAGGHPFAAGTSFRPAHLPTGHPVEDMKDVTVSVPRGFVGVPTSTPRCTIGLGTNLFPLTPTSIPLCPVSTQVGVADLDLAGADAVDIPVYSIEPPHGVAARFGFGLAAVDVVIDASVRPTDFGVDLTSRSTSQASTIHRIDVELWGVPADESHDALRAGDGVPLAVVGGSGAPAGTPERAFIAIPADCDAGILTTTLRSNSWQNPDRFGSISFDHDVSQSPPFPMAVENCDKVPFDPDLSLQPTTRVADAPTGLEVNLSIPQDGLSNPTGIATAHLKRATVRLPEGMTINPSAADGLEACSDAQLRLGLEGPARCPDGSKIGTVVVDTPVLEEQLGGSVYIRSQNSDDPQSGEMFRIAIEIRNDERGIAIRLPGEVRADPRTGRLVTTFDDNPQLPFSNMKLRFKGGDRAPLATPPSCGTHTTDTTLTSWSGHTVELRDSFTIDCPGQGGFAPRFRGGTLAPTGGAFSPLVVRIDRDDRERFLAGVSVDLPKGMVAKLRGVELCPNSLAADGTPGSCQAGSRIGTATVAAGAGPSPFVLGGAVYLTGPYKGAPYGLSTQVRAKAGPFDLGMVKVRQALHVDPVTAEVSAVSDPMPQIVKGVPVRLRSANVDADRPRFTINPTSCAEKRVAATFTSSDAAVRHAASPFQASDCRALGFKPRLTMGLSGRKQRRTGGHPRLRAVLTQGKGQANVASAKVTLPKSVVLDARNAYDPELVCDYDRALKADCPASSVIGRAVAETPVLDKPLAGNVHLVQGIKFGTKGNRIRTLPTLLVKLRGEVAIDLRAKTSTSTDDRLVTTFPEVPDAPVSKFTMSIDGGSKGILVVTRTRRSRIDICKGRQIADVETDGQNGRRSDYSVRVVPPCRGAAARRASRDRKEAR